MVILVILNKFIKKAFKKALLAVITITFLQHFALFAMEENPNTKKQIKFTPETPEITKENAPKLIHSAIINEDTNLLKNLLKFYKENNIDINKKIDINGRENSLLWFAVAFDKVDSTKFLLKNGVKLENIVKTAYVKQNLSGLIKSKPMAELLIPLGTDLPSSNRVISNLITSFNSNDPLSRSSAKKPNIMDKKYGIDFITYLYTQGVVFNAEDLKKLNDFLEKLDEKKDHHIYRTSQVNMSILEKNIEHLKEIIKFLENKLKK